MARHADAESETSGFEAAGRVSTFLFYINAGIAAAAQHWRPAFSKADRLNIGQDAAIAPEAFPRIICGIVGDLLTRCKAAQRREVVTNVQCSRTLRANGLGFLRGHVRMAARAFQVADFWHVQTIAAAKISGKFPRKPRKNFTPSCATGYDVAAYRQIHGLRDGSLPEISSKANSVSLAAGLVLFAAGALLTLVLPAHGIFPVLRWCGLALLAISGAKGRSLTYWIFVAMLAGFELGIDRPEFAVRLRVLGDIFLRLVKVIVAPLILGTLVTGIAAHS